MTFKLPLRVEHFKRYGDERLEGYTIDDADGTCFASLTDDGMNEEAERFVAAVNAHAGLLDLLGDALLALEAIYRKTSLGERIIEALKAHGREG